MTLTSRRPHGNTPKPHHPQRRLGRSGRSSPQTSHAASRGRLRRNPVAPGGSRAIAFTTGVLSDRATPLAPTRSRDRPARARSLRHALSCLAARRGRLHSPDDARAKPREADVRRRAAGSPRKGAPAPTDADDRFDDSRHLRRTLASTDRARRKPASRRSGTGAVSGARFSREAQAAGLAASRSPTAAQAYAELASREPLGSSASCPAPPRLVRRISYLGPPSLLDPPTGGSAGGLVAPKLLSAVQRDASLVAGAICTLSGVVIEGRMTPVLGHSRSLTELA